jgi:hypothetical protein
MYTAKKYVLLRQQSMHRITQILKRRSQSFLVVITRSQIS